MLVVPAARMRWQRNRLIVDYALRKRNAHAVLLVMSQVKGP